MFVETKLIVLYGRDKGFYKSYQDVTGFICAVVGMILFSLKLILLGKIYKLDETQVMPTHMVFFIQ